MAEAAVRGRPRQSSLDDDGSTSRPGVGVDAQGGQVVDPTKNVEDLVKTLEDKISQFRSTDNRYIDSQISWLEKTGHLMRDADNRMSKFAREAGERLDAAMRESERIRLNELAATRKEYENTIRDMLAKSVETTSTLVSTQLVQIQATFDKRVSQLEAYQFTQAGRSSVADPALANALTLLAEGQKKTQMNFEGAMGEMTRALMSVRETQSGTSASSKSGVDLAAAARSNISLIVSLAVGVTVLLTYLRGVIH